MQRQAIGIVDVLQLREPDTGPLNSEGFAAQRAPTVEFQRCAIVAGSGDGLHREFYIGARLRVAITNRASVDVDVADPGDGVVPAEMPIVVTVGVLLEQHAGFDKLDLDRLTVEQG